MADLDDVKTNQDEEIINGAATREDSDKLKDLIAQATLKYSVKDYEAAAELYAFATELQAEVNGEMSPENADLLYAYGRCLYHVAVKNSDVLGSKVAGEVRDEDTKGGKEKQQSKRKAASEGADGPSNGIATDAAASNGSKDNAKESESGSKPYFQFTGDENFDTSDEDEVDNDEGGEGGEEAEGDEDEDDFVVAYEVLDLARVLLQKKIEEVTASHRQPDSDNIDKGKSISPPSSHPSTLSPELRRLNERLADTYDIQAEISLEGERFPSAVVDLRSALALKQTLYAPESSLMAEAHFKLSLALEFSSITQAKDANGEVAEGTVAQVDEKMREEAAVEIEAAIASCRLRIAKEEARLAQQQQNQGQANGSGGLESGNPTAATTTTKTTKADIDDVKEMVKDLQQRLIEIRQPPVSITDNLPTTSTNSSSSATTAEQRARLEEAARGAKDLTDLVVKKKKKNTPQDDINNGERAAAAAAAAAVVGSSSSSNGTGAKRKADDLLTGGQEQEQGEGEEEAEGGEGGRKKVKS